MEKLEYRGLISNWAVVNRLNDDSGFVLLLSHFLNRFIGPYLVTILKDEVLSNTVVKPARMNTLGWIIRSPWLPSLVAFERTAKEQGRKIEILDEGGGLAIVFGTVGNRSPQQTQINVSDSIDP